MLEAKGLQVLEAEVAELRERKATDSTLSAGEIKRINGQIRAKSIAIARYKRALSCPDLHNN